MTRILFLIPPINYTEKKSRGRFITTHVVPYGVLSIASYIKAYSTKEVEVKILDFNTRDYSLEEMVQEIKENICTMRPGIVGVSALFNPMFPYIEPFFKVVKEVDENIITTLGGAIATNMYREVMEREENLDAACFSEGEIPFLDLVAAEDKRALLDIHEAWITRKSLMKGQMPKAKLVEDLDTLPLIDYSLVELKYYKARSWYATTTADDDVIHALPIHTTRGCPFNCVFCCAGSLHGKKLRRMSAKRVLEHVHDMVEKYGIKRLTIDDDQFLLTKDRSKEILRGLIPYGLSLEAESGLSVRFIDDEMARLLKEAGLQCAPIAVESGSEYMLKDIMDKPVKLDEVREAVKCLRKYNLQIKSFIVVGLPGETDEIRRETRDFINEVGFDWNLINVATPFKGSRLYTMCADKGYFDEKTLSSGGLSTGSSIINTPEYTAEYISKQAYIMNLDTNFVNNYNLRIGNYEIAAQYFNTVAIKYPQQAFAHYFLAKAYELGNFNRELISVHREIFNKIINQDVEWKEYSRIFGIV